MATQEKRPRLRLTKDNNGDDRPDASIFILPHKIQKRRLEILRRNAKAKNLPFVDEFSEKVTYVVSELSSREQTLKALQHASDVSLPLVVVKSSWLSRCIQTGTIENVEEEDQLLQEKSSDDCELKQTREVEHVAEYACQRVTMLHHPNGIFTRSLEVLEEFADFKDDELNYARALAFRRASAVLKSLKQRVSSIQDVINLPDIGGHCLQVIQEILDNGFSAEVESVEESDWYKKMKLFTSVFGVGPATAKKWISMGISTIAEAKSHPEIAGKADPRISFGLTYFDDLNTPVKAFDAERLAQMIRDDAQSIRPGTMVALAGGFRRGKEHGHDIDLLITHPVDGQENGILSELLQRLEERQLIMFGRREPYSFNEHIALLDNKGTYLRSTLDHFEKWIGVLKLYSYPWLEIRNNNTTKRSSEDAQPKPCQHLTSTSENSENTSELCSENKSKIGGHEGPAVIGSTSNDPVTSETDQCLTADCDNNLRQTPISENINKPLCNQCRSWIARRVDLIVIPKSQFSYGLVGWTGNRHFNRSLRLYAQKELGLKLTSHGLFDKLGNSIPAENEEEVFQNLKLPYLHPFDRNC